MFETYHLKRMTTEFAIPDLKSPAASLSLRFLDFLPSEVGLFPVRDFLRVDIKFQTRGVEFYTTDVFYVGDFIQLKQDFETKTDFEVELGGIDCEFECFIRCDGKGIDIEGHFPATHYHQPRIEAGMLDLRNRALIKQSFRIIAPWEQRILFIQQVQQVVEQCQSILQEENIQQTWAEGLSTRGNPDSECNNPKQD